MHHPTQCSNNSNNCASKKGDSSPEQARYGSTLMTRQVDPLSPQSENRKPGEFRMAKTDNVVKELFATSSVKSLQPCEKAEDLWAQLMTVFDSKATIYRDFVASLPGYECLPYADRDSLFEAALFPLCAAVQAIDFGAAKFDSCFFDKMDDGSVKLCTRLIPACAKIRCLLHEIGSCVKKADLNQTEFSLLCALIFFNSDVPSQLVAPEKVSEMECEFKQAFINCRVEEAGGKKIADERVVLVSALARQICSIVEKRFTEANAEICKQLRPEVLKISQRYHDLYFSKQ